MFVGTYRFAGDPQILLPAYQRLMATVPPDTSDLHVCLVDDGGIMIIDSCPSRDVFSGFSTSAGFREAVAAAGLPAPEVVPLGTVHAARLSRTVTP